MLKAGFIKHTVNKTTFSEQCYYAFGDEATISAGGRAVMFIRNVSMIKESL